MLFGILFGIVVGTVPSSVFAEDCAQTTPVINAPNPVVSTSLTSSSSVDSPTDEPVSRARELLSRARSLDVAATQDEKLAAEVTSRLPTLRASAKAARSRADHASGDDREMLIAQAEDLEADVAISEAEITHRRRTANENRRQARELRAHAIHVVRDAAPTPAPAASAPCEPPYRITATGRKIYRIECLR